MSRNKTFEINIKTPVYTGNVDNIKIDFSSRETLSMVKLLIPKQVDVTEIILNELNTKPKKFIAIYHNDNLFEFMDTNYEFTYSELPYNIMKIKAFLFMLDLDIDDNEYKYKSIYEIYDFKNIIKCYELLSKIDYNEEQYNEVVYTSPIDDKLVENNLEFLKKFYTQNAEIFI